MVELNKHQIKSIEDFVSYPNGLGYVLDFSDQSFLDWFHDNFGIRIGRIEYRESGKSKRHRLISFCKKHETDLVVSVLQQIYSRGLSLQTENGPHPEESVGNFVITIGEIRDGRPYSRSAHIEVSNKVIGRDVVSKNLHANSDTLMLLTSSALVQIAEFKEHVRTSNEIASIDLEFRDNLLSALKSLDGQLKKLVALIPDHTEATNVTRDEAAQAWTTKFINSAIPAWGELLDAKKLGKTSAPVSIVLVCGAIGSGLTGFSPLGFGVGSLVGKLVTGEMKGGAAAAKIEKHFSEE